MENDIFDSLGDLGYDGPLSDPDAFSKAIDDGLKSLDFIKLVCELAGELKTLCKVEESVNTINSLEETSSFMLELSSFLKELGCPYRGLISGHMSSRLQTKETRVTLLDYLISEIMAARMVSVDCPNENQPPNMDIVMQESPTAKALKEILIALKFNKPPPNITPEVLFSKLEAKLKETIQKEGQQLVGKPLYNKALTEKDWKELDNIFTEMYDEYRLRRETLISRLECTIQSFEWSDRLKGKKDQMQAIYRPKREQMKVKPEVKLCDFLAARTSLLHVDKTSSANVRKNTQSEVNKVIIGQVPDRGGRPNEQQPPPPEMPSWQQRSAPQGGRGGGQRGGRDGSGGGRGRGGGGRVQGGYNQGQQDQNRSVSQLTQLFIAIKNSEKKFKDMCEVNPHLVDVNLA
ncbi:PREDICTED: protein FAM98A [Papilio xuthus]|uniref:Protein FAM98A n=1 Tax=Papilio xuthus TaxID=66420 RepID=A0AAJ6ZSJ2_PAPXU|nr:PREDICTED: protein FAM98A [Papilio xuthus]